MTVLRLLSYNVRSLRDDSAAVARVIRDAKPDVVCIQEAPRFLRWRSKCASLARRSGLVVIAGGRRPGANLVLSSLGVDVIAAHEVRFTKDPKLHQRGAVIAVLAKGGHRFAVAGTHLDLAADPRLRHVGELRDHASRLVPVGVPLIVAGDMNEEPGDPAWRALTDLGMDAFAAVGTGDGYTFSARDPRRRIDGVFLGQPLTARSATVLESPDVQVASDHRPLLVEIDLDGATR